MALYVGKIELVGHAACAAVEVGLHAANAEEAAQNAPAFVRDRDSTLRLGRILEDFAEVPATEENVETTTGWINLIR
jgi:hypothetical protein